MRTSFLCPTHRSWLISEPMQAIACWQREFEAACTHLEQGDLRDALPHAGSAFETAGILLHVRVMEPSQAIRCFLQATSLLLESLQQLQLTELHEEMYNSAVTALEQQAQRHRSLAPAIQFQLRRLSSHRPRHNTVTVMAHNTWENHHGSHSRVLH